MQSAAKSDEHGWISVSLCCFEKGSGAGAGVSAQFTQARAIPIPNNEPPQPDQQHQDRYHPPYIILIPPPLAKFTDFSRTTNDFFNREFPSNQIKLESRTSSKGLLLSAGRAQTFTDEFKVITVKDLTSGGLAAEVKNTSSFALIKDRVGIPLSGYIMVFSWWCRV